MSLSKLNWTKTTLGEVAKWSSGGTPKRTNNAYYGGSIPWVKTGDLGGRVLNQSSEFITEEGLKNSSAKLFPKGSLGLAMYGATIGKVSIFGIEAACNQACAVAVPDREKIHTDFLYYLLKNEKEAFIKKGKGGAQPNISQTIIKAHEITIPSVEEQKRIADKLDSVLAKVETAQARLDKIPAILKRFRQSVLAAATSGELTKEWREDNGADLEWKQVQVSEIVEKIEAGKSIKCDERPPQNDEFGIIKISAVTWGVYNEQESKTLFDKSVFLENRRISVGDFLISRANTIELLGMPVIVREVTKNLMLSDKVLRLVMDDIDKSWLSFYFRSPEGRKQIENGSSGNQESMRNIGQKALMAIKLKNPTKLEKLEIISRVDELFNKADSVEQQYYAAKARLDKLTQSILKKAFKGELLSSSVDSEVVKALDGDLAMQY